MAVAGGKSGCAMAETKLKPFLDREMYDSLYSRYNRREYVSPDPLQFLYDYPDPAEREVVGLVASSLAYGHVQQILKTIRTVLDRIPDPLDFVTGRRLSTIQRRFSGFKYRFTTGDQLSLLLYGIGRVVKKHGSLEKCFLSGFNSGADGLTDGISRLVEEISNEAGFEFGHLLPHPCRKSACKRLNLFMRWMVREDDVDPGGWYNIPPGELLIPLDIHMYRICRALGLTSRRQSDLKTSIEITESFRKINPEDPVRYDFALTRLGIRDELDPMSFISECVTHQ